MRLNERFKPERLANGETLVEIITKSKHSHTQSRERWIEQAKERNAILFEQCPKIKESYELVDELRRVFRVKNRTKEEAKIELGKWYSSVASNTLREVKSARDTIKRREDEVLNYFVNRATNASAESIHSKVKGFRTQLHGVSDVKFFMFRLCTLFG